MSGGKHSEESTQKKELGLHTIEKAFSRKIEESVTKIQNGSLRSGNKIEFEGSVVVLGDINAGAEVIAEEHIIVLRKHKRTSTCRSERKQKCNNCCKFNRSTTNKNSEYSKRNGKTRKP